MVRLYRRSIRFDLKEHDVKGRSEKQNTAAPVANAYGLTWLDRILDKKTRTNK